MNRGVKGQLLKLENAGGRQKVARVDKVGICLLGSLLPAWVVCARRRIAQRSIDRLLNGALIAFGFLCNDSIPIQIGNHRSKNPIRVSILERSQLILVACRKTRDIGIKDRARHRNDNLRNMLKNNAALRRRRGWFLLFRRRGRRGLLLFRRGRRRGLLAFGRGNLAAWSSRRSGFLPSARLGRRLGACSIAGRIACRLAGRGSLCIAKVLLARRGLLCPGSWQIDQDCAKNK